MPEPKKSPEPRPPKKVVPEQAGPQPKPPKRPKPESANPDPQQSRQPKPEGRSGQSAPRSEQSKPEPAAPGPSEPKPLAPEQTDPEKTDPGASDAGAGSPAQRMRHALRSPSRSQVVVAVLLAILGFAAVTQVRSIESDDTYEGRREEDLIEILNGVTGTSDRARREIAQLEQTRRNLETDSNARRAAIEQAEERLETLNILAGLVPVSGPGVRVTITEEETPVRVDRLLDLVQELRTAGAEAIEINDQVRLVAQSSFQEVDGRLEVDGVPLDPPYVVEAIGEPNTLEGGVGFPSGPVAALRNEDGADVVIERPAEVVIESVRDLARTDFAEPAQGQ